MPDFEKSDSLISEVWKLKDEQLAVLFAYIANYLYGNAEFNTAVENALEKMKVAEGGRK